MHVFRLVEHLVLDARERQQSLVAVNLQCLLRYVEHVADILVVHPILQACILL